MEDKNPSRFTGGPRTIYSFTNTFVVECPHCRNRAEVRKNSVSGQYEFHCYACHRCLAQRMLYTLSVNQYCPDCGYRLKVNLPAVKQKTSFIRLTCPDCDHTNKFTPTYEGCVLPIAQGGEIEPHFGTELWLQVPFGADTLWAYNYEHLQHLKQYVQAKLRQRQAPDFSPMVERLPTFIKSAKNRDSLLAAIERLTLKK
ncbi:hypothetical protein E5K00_02495 [Hymenobacter aquaticus]|uniref:Replication restart DNA helicase PriA n=1 Tax=Hymenobacter aquaticus TaxID=1867101 RepID=A0A4Z0Q4Q2_9BACT|nr:hypothetical protein [Hymenobacter aquaticus]TGE24103.1 hypothetical protein E5K00_02495 [Hymenobacter aquaticus]